MKCSRCGLGNTEYSMFITTSYKYVGSGLVGRVLRWLDVVPEIEVLVCQKCQSIMFRNLDKDK